MKVIKNNLNTKTKANQIDKVVKNNIDLASIQPIRNWNKSDAWIVIRDQLKGTNKTLVAWGISIAASLGLAIATSISLDYPLFQSPVDQAEKPLFAKSPRSNQAQLATTHTQYPEIIDIKPFSELNIKETKLPKGETLIFSDDNSHVACQADIMDFQETIVEPRLEPYFSLHQNSSRGMQPELGVNFQLFAKTKGNIKRTFKLGTSASFQVISSEKQTRIQPFGFVNVSYDRSNILDNRGWSATAGYLINPDSNVYNKNTVRLSVNKKFGRRIQAGPEVIFTDNFKQAYPGVSIVFS